MKPGTDDETKRTNEIGTVIPLLDQLDTIAGKTLTADALPTQLASYLLERNAHYLFIAKNNQPNLLLDIAVHFTTEGTRPPEFEEPPTLAHGRIEQRAIWTTTALNDYLDFPNVGQAFMLRRIRHHKATGKTSTEIVYGVTSLPPECASPQRLLTLNRGHWCIENSSHHCLDWSFDEDRCRIRTGYGPRKHHPPATLRHHPHQGAEPQCRRDPATAQPLSPHRPRLPQNDRQHPAQTPPLSPHPLPQHNPSSSGSSPQPEPCRLVHNTPPDPNPAIDQAAKRCQTPIPAPVQAAIQQLLASRASCRPAQRMN